MPSVSDHLRPTTADYPAGVYRVVGTSETTVTLLRVGDEAGQRVHTGEIVHVDRDALEEFAQTEPPSGGGVVRAVTGFPELLYDQLTAFPSSLAARPAITGVASVLLVAGLFGEQVTAVPRLAETGLILAGSLGLALAGSGRL